MLMAAAYNLPLQWAAWVHFFRLVESRGGGRVGDPGSHLGGKLRLMIGDRVRIGTRLHQIPPFLGILGEVRRNLGGILVEFRPKDTLKIFRNGPTSALNLLEIGQFSSRQSQP